MDRISGSLAPPAPADTNRMGLPPTRGLLPGTPVTGWVAVSINKIKLGDQKDNPADFV